MYTLLSHFKLTSVCLVRMSLHVYSVMLCFGSDASRRGEDQTASTAKPFPERFVSLIICLFIYVKVVLKCLVAVLL